jgi:hypothetical protein
MQTPTIYIPLSSSSNFGLDSQGYQSFSNYSGGVHVTGKYTGAMYSTANNTGGCYNTAATEWNTWKTFSWNFWYKIISLPTAGNGSVFFYLPNLSAGVYNDWYTKFSFEDFSPYGGGSNSLKIRFACDNHGIYTTVIESTVSLSADNTWHMATYTCSFSAPNYTYNFYIDTSSQGTVTNSKNGSFAGAAGASIGTNPPTGGSQGLYPYTEMCELKLYKNYVLTTSDISALYTYNPTSWTAQQIAAGMF